MGCRVPTLSQPALRPLLSGSEAGRLVCRRSPERPQLHCQAECPGIDGAQELHQGAAVMLGEPGQPDDKITGQHGAASPP